MGFIQERGKLSSNRDGEEGSRKRNGERLGNMVLISQPKKRGEKGEGGEPLCTRRKKKQVI